MEKYVFKTTHLPLNLEEGLYKIAQNRPSEWHLICTLLEQNGQDLKEGNIEYEKWFNKLLSSWTLGQFLEECLTKLSSSNPLNLVLCDLIEDYVPIKVRQEDLELREIQAELGQNVTFAVSAQGSPTLTFHWFFWPTFGQNSEWQKLDEVKTNEIIIEDMRIEDVGTYKCLIQHSFKVVDENGSEIRGAYTGGVEICVEPDSIFVLEQPQDQNCTLLDNIQFKVCVESPSKLTFQWYHEDKVIVGAVDRILNLTRVSLDHRGSYKCLIKADKNCVESKITNLEVELPTIDQFTKLEFENEDIEIIQQPILPFKNVKAAIGEKVHLTCLAACKFPLKYEWLKKPVRTDLIAKSAEIYLDTELVGLSCQLIDEIQDIYPPVSFYLYQCHIHCLKTGQKLVSNPVKIPVSTYTAPDKSLPVFKIALLICQEEYDNSACFQSLLAPRSDGNAVAKALQEIDFEVMPFSNLNVNEILKALDLFCSFVNEQTYAFIYFNGHALGHRNDIYLVGKDTDLTQEDSTQQLVCHSEVEIALDRCRPLFATIIYDSCRDQFPEHVGKWVKTSAGIEPLHTESNFCIGYGTRQSMRSFVKMDKSGLSQSLYTKYLLQHIKSKISVGAMFEKLNCSFTKGEDASIVAQMKPEFKDSTRQSFSLTAPLRHSYASGQHKRFFRLCRFEAINDNSIQVQLGLAICRETEMPIWIKGKTYTQPQALVKLSLESSQFLNEAYLNISVKTSCEKFNQSHLQVIPQNVKMSVNKRNFGPYQSQDEWDGPLFKLDETEKNFKLVSKCHLTALQEISDSALKFRLFLMYQGCTIPCQGVIKLPVPLCKNMPNLKIANC